MKLPSIDYLARNALATLFRFPWVLAMACAGTGLAIRLSEWKNDSWIPDSRMGHLIMACSLCISFFFGLTMMLERTRLPKAARFLVFIPALALSGLYAYSLEEQADFQVWARFALFLLASHLFAAVSPYLRGGRLRGFWEFNHRIFMRIIVSGVFSACLFLGVAAAMAAVKHLFDAPIPEKAFLWLWFCVAGIFNTWFFLAGVPDDFEELDREHPYPRPLQVLTQFLLVPLVTLYLVILYSYALKIALGRQWPIGWVSYLILICSLLGIFSLLLIHPIQERKENQWIKAFSRYFYFALFPLLLLLFAAIGKRISEYRLTENRYFVAVMACWLTGIALYFTFSRVRNIKVIPVSLGLLALATSFGPWGAFQVSRNSQLERLRGMLAEQGLLKDGKLVAAGKPIPRDIEARIGSVVEYLAERKQLESARPWLTDSTSPSADWVLSDKHAFLKRMGLEFVPVGRNGKAGIEQFQSYTFRSGTSRLITGFDYFLGRVETHMDTALYLMAPSPHDCRVRFPKADAKVRIFLKGDSLMMIDLLPMLDSLAKEYPDSWHKDIPAEKLYREATSGGYTVGLQVRRILRETVSGRLQDLDADVFLKVPSGD
jgi:hypothetical protein